MDGLAVQAYSLLIGIALAAAGIPVSPSSLTARAVVSSGHRGAVLDMAADSARGLLFSVGEDGFLRVWDSRAGYLLRRFAVTRRKAQSVALDPAAPLAAIVVTDGPRSYAVDVWDWDAGKRIYSIPLRSAPLFVRFSRSGTYLLFGEMKWDSLHILRAADGTPVPFHPEGFGMVSFAETSRTDAALMTYQPIGRISYWDLATGLPIKEVRTIEGLVDVRPSDDRGCLVGQSGTHLVGIDATSGETRFRMNVDGISSIDVSADAGEIACLFTDGSLQVRSPDGRLSSPLIDKGFDWRPVLVRMTSHGIMVAGDDGQIGMISDDGTACELARDVLARVTGIAAQGRMLAVAAADVIRVFALGVSGPGMSPVTEAFSIANPYPGPVGLEFLEGRLVVWQQGSAPGALGSSLVRIDMRTGVTEPIPGSSRLTFSLAPDPAKGSEYALGVGPDGRTFLTRHDGASLETEIVLDGADGGYPLGTTRGTLALRAMDGLLASLQRDSSVSIWDTTADRSFGRIYPFADGSWAAVMADGTILGSADGKNKVGILVKGRLWQGGKIPRTSSSQEKASAP